MSANSDNRLPVAIEVSAKASATLDVKGEVPSSSLGRALDALVDMIRPFSESRGFKADQIRLQREEVLLQIAHRARVRAEVERIELKPVPNKFLVPFLEKASLEEQGSELTDRWTDLLLSASEDGETPARFISVLSELSSSNVKTLKAISCSHRTKLPIGRMEDAPHSFYDNHVTSSLKYGLKKKQFSSEDEAINTIIELLEIPGGILLHIFFDLKGVSEFAESHHHSLMGDTLRSQREFEENCAVLESLGLLRTGVYNGSFGNVEFLSIWFCHITLFGIKFLVSCDREVRKGIESAYGEIKGDEHTGK